MAGISSQAVVDPNARLAGDVCVGPFSYVGPEVQMASGCVIESNVTIAGRTTLGENTHIFPLAVIGLAPSGCDSPGPCIIGPDNTIREHVVVYAGDADCPTTLGRGNLVMIASQIGAAATIGDDGIFANCTIIETRAWVESLVRTSAFCVIGAGVHVGAYTFIGPHAVVDRNAPPFAMLQGGQCRIRGVNSHNLTRCGFSETDIRKLKNVFRELFDSDNGNANLEVLERLSKSDQHNEHIRHLLEALKETRPSAGEGARR